jgi:large subunit ribosomal protein L4
MPSKKGPKAIKISKGSKVPEKLSKTVVVKKVANAKVSVSAKKAVAPNKTTTKPKAAVVKSTGLTVKVYDTNGKITGSITLPKEIFGQKPNKNLLAQAMHIYFTNTTAHYGSTKTRSETRGGGKKPWKQKGTGNARAGSRRSPLWVGGAVALGPKPRKTTLALPKKMKKSALISALSSKANDGSISVISNLESIKPKTKIVANILDKVGVKGATLLVTSAKSDNIKLASRNIQNVTVNEARNLNPYLVLKSRTILFSKEALSKIS